jgi:hypothetical protein
MAVTRLDMITSETTLGAVDSALGPPPGEVGDWYWVVWVGAPSHLDVSLDRGRYRLNELDFLSTLGDPREHHFRVALTGKYRSLSHLRPFFGCRRLAHRHTLCQVWQST